MKKQDSELHLFILWEHARFKQDEILADVAARFCILQVFSIRWSDPHFSANLSRFYGQKLPSGSSKEKQCGRGPFLLILVRDDAPRYELRQTSAGSEAVNCAIFDAKQRYRQITGGGHRIHGTNSVQEVNHDLTLLLGPAYEPDPYATWDGTIAELYQDLPGTNGWKSLKEVLSVLNRAIPYVVLRNFENFPHGWTLEGHADVDLLVHKRQDAALIANGKRVFRSPSRVQYYVPIAEQQIPFDIRFVGDDYFDKKWQLAVLWSRVKHPRGFYMPDPVQYFYTLLYHALVHKTEFADDYRERLADMAAAIETLDRDDLSSRDSALSCLRSFMDAQGYVFTDPSDLSVVFSPPADANVDYRIRRQIKNLRCVLARPIGKIFKRL